MNSKKEYVYVVGIAIFIAITSFKFGSDYSIFGLKQPQSLAYKDGILYVANKNGYISMLDEYGNILELDFLHVNDPSNVLVIDYTIVVSSDNTLLFYKLPSKLETSIKFNDKIVQIARKDRKDSDILVLLANGDILLVSNNKQILLCKVHNATSIASSSKYLFVATQNTINAYNYNCQLLFSIAFSIPMRRINYNDGVISVTSTSNNEVFLLNERLQKIKSYKFDKPTFAIYSKNKLFVCSLKLGKVYIKS